MSDKILFTCRVCGCEVSGHPIAKNDIGEDVGIQGVCEKHCKGHEYEFDYMRCASFCLYCDHKQEYWFGDYEGDT